MRSIGVPTATLPVSVMPQTSSIGTPSAMYQRTRSGEIGAAPVISMRLRWMPISLRHIVQHQCPRQPVGELQPAADGLALFVAAHLLQADADGQLVGPLLEGIGFLERDADAGIELLPDPRHGAEHRGRDLAHVLGNGFRVLDEIELGAGVEREIGAAGALGDVAQRQEAHALVVFVLRRRAVEALHRGEQVGVREHRALGLAGGARGVDQDREIVGLARRDACLPFGIGRRPAQPGEAFAAHFAQALEADHLFVVQVAQALHVPDHDAAQERQARAHFQHLVELLVVLDENQHGIRIAGQVFDLG
jgi:hypothetical protein